jgi:rare lipoprotein A
MRGIFLLAVILGASGCRGPQPPAEAGVTAPARVVGADGWREYERGIASWYGGRWHGRRTANGERYDQRSMTAAHKRLPFHTKVKVTNLRNGQSCVVRINNRGPHIRGRVIDLSVAAAKKIDAYKGGLTRVKLEVER